MSVAAVRFDSESVILTLHSGGEIRCGRSLVAQVSPDELPRPEPAGASTNPGAPSDAAAGGVPYAGLISRLAGQHQVDPALVHAVVRVESAYRADATSPRGAMGLMQLMPATARQYGVADAYDPESNLSAGIRHLKSLLDRHTLREAVAAYNAGEDAVRRHGGVPPFPETRAYVRAVLAEVGGDRR